jgi:hypothetical protein
VLCSSPAGFSRVDAGRRQAAEHTRRRVGVRRDVETAPLAAGLAARLLSSLVSAKQRRRAVVLTEHDVLVGYRLRLFTLADEFGSVAEACRLMGTDGAWRR